MANTAAADLVVAPGARQRLDQLPLSRFHWKLLFVSGLGWMFDAMDILIVGAVVAASVPLATVDEVAAELCVLLL
jgi:hypothetical protein